MAPLACLLVAAGGRAALLVALPLVAAAAERTSVSSSELFGEPEGSAAAADGREMPIEGKGVQDVAGAVNEPVEAKASKEEALGSTTTEVLQTLGSTTDVPQALDSSTESPQASDSTTEVSQALDSTTEAPQALDSSTKAPDSSTEASRELASTTEVSQALGSTTEAPQAPLALDSTTEAAPQTLGSSSEALDTTATTDVPEALALTTAVPQALGSGSEAAQALGSTTEAPQALNSSTKASSGVSTTREGWKDGGEEEAPEVAPNSTEKAPVKDLLEETTEEDAAITFGNVKVQPGFRVAAASLDAQGRMQANVLGGLMASLQDALVVKQKDLHQLKSRVANTTIYTEELRRQISAANETLGAQRRAREELSSKIQLFMERLRHIRASYDKTLLDVRTLLSTV